MARPQSGVLPAPLQYNRIQTLEVHDLPMTSMTVGQFSVMIPGLAHQLAHAMPQEAFKVTVAFGFMFWTLAWHGKSPRMFRPFEELEAGEQVIAEGEGDLWVHYSATRPELITRLIRKVDENIGSLVRVLDDFDVFHDKGSENPEPVSPEIWIPDNEPDFSRGTLLTHFAVLREFTNHTTQTDCTDEGMPVVCRFRHCSTRLGSRTLRQYLTGAHFGRRHGRPFNQGVYGARRL